MFEENLQRFPQPHRFPHLPIRAPFWNLKKERERKRGRCVKFQSCTMAPLTNLPASQKLNRLVWKNLYYCQLIFTGLWGNKNFQWLDIYKCYCCPPNMCLRFLRDTGIFFNCNKGEGVWVLNGEKSSEENKNETHINEYLVILNLNTT